MLAPGTHRYVRSCPLQFAPPLFALPPLGNTLACGSASLAAAAAPAKPKKAAGTGSGRGGGRKKKAVKFEGGEGHSSGSGHGAATSQHTHSGGAAQTSSALGTQAGPLATQAVTAAVSAGLGRLAVEGWKMRSLLLPALSTLGVGAQPAQEHCCYGMLPSAAYVLADLHRKLKAALAVRRAAFPGKAPKQQRPAGRVRLGPASAQARPGAL